MKLAEALKLRADNQVFINELRGRLQRSAVTQEGSQPLEDVGELLHVVNSAVNAQVDLITRINLTNAATVLANGMTMTEALARRELVMRQRGIYEFLIAHTSNALQQFRGRSTELRAVSFVDVPAIQKLVDGMAVELRHLDSTIQQANWSIDLMD